MPGLHPFDFMDLAPNELPPELQADGARSIGRLVAHIEQQGLRASVEQSLEIPAALWRSDQIGRAHVCTPVPNEHLVCRLLLEKKKTLIGSRHTTQNTDKA